MSIILCRDHWGETSVKWILEGIQEFFNVNGKTVDCKIVNKDKEEVPLSDWCVRWATTSSVPGKPKIINKASSIHAVYNKGIFRKQLADAELAPKTWINDLPDEYPVVIRPMQHGKSEDLHIANTETQAKKAIQKILIGGSESYYCSEFIDKDKEYRVFIVSGRVVGMAEKIPLDTDLVSWGCVTEGTFKYIHWSKFVIPVVATAIHAFNLSGLDFGAVDVILKGSDSYVLEINTGPNLGEYWGYQMGAGIGFILESESRDIIPVGSKPEDWRSYVHPAICNAAIA